MSALFNKYLVVFICILTLSTAHCGGGGDGSSAEDADDSDDDDGSTSATVTVSGQVAVSDSDANLSLPPNLKAATKNIRPQFATIATAVLASTEVSLVKITGDGEEETVTTATTDATGNYSFADVPIAVGGNGEDTDFYYEVRVGGDLDVRAPVAPTGDSATETANISPESTLAARIISDVVNVPGSDSNPIPGPEIFADVAGLVDTNVDDLADVVTVPSNSADATSDVVDFANGIAAAGGDAEVMYKAYQFESEFTSLANTDATDAGDYSAYLERVVNEGCDQPTSNNVLPNLAAQAIAAAMVENATFTPEEVVTAFDAVADSSSSAADAVSDYAALLDELDTTSTAALIKHVATVDDDNRVAAFTQRELDPDTLATTTELDPDQALSFLYNLGNGGVTPCSFDAAGAIAELTGSTLFDDPKIAEVELYHDSGFGCNAGDSELHFRTRVEVYLPTGSAVTVSSVTVQSTDTDALDTDPNDGVGTGLVNLAADPGGRIWEENDSEADPDCVEINQNVTYTITANFSNGSSDTETVTRNHANVPEADVTHDGTALASNSNTATVVTDARPLLTWEDPETVLATITNAPAGSQVKYTYEYSHMRVGAGAPITPSTGCPSVTSGALYAVDNFIPTIDCDVDACASEQGTTSDQVTCRINVQTFLVDENDNLLGQAAGEFKFLCVDTNGDGDCGA